MKKLSKKTNVLDKYLLDNEISVTDSQSMKDNFKKYKINENEIINEFEKETKNLFNSYKVSNQENFIENELNKKASNEYLKSINLNNSGYKVNYTNKGNKNVVNQIEESQYNYINNYNNLFDSYQSKLKKNYDSYLKDKYSIRKNDIKIADETYKSFYKNFYSTLKDYCEMAKDNKTNKISIDDYNSIIDYIEKNKSILNKNDIEYFKVYVDSYR